MQHDEKVLFPTEITISRAKFFVFVSKVLPLPLQQLNTMYKPSVRVPAPKIGGGPASSSAFKVSSSPPLICLLKLLLYPLLLCLYISFFFHIWILSLFNFPLLLLYASFNDCISVAELLLLLQSVTCCKFLLYLL